MGSPPPCSAPLPLSESHPCSWLRPLSGKAPLQLVSNPSPSGAATLQCTTAPLGKSPLPFAWPQLWWDASAMHSLPHQERRPCSVKYVLRPLLWTRAPAIHSVPLWEGAPAIFSVYSLIIAKKEESFFCFSFVLSIVKKDDRAIFCKKRCCFTIFTPVLFWWLTHLTQLI